MTTSKNKSDYTEKKRDTPEFWAKQAVKHLGAQRAYEIAVEHSQGLNSHRAFYSVAKGWIKKRFNINDKVDVKTESEKISAQAQLMTLTRKLSNG